MPDDPTPHQPSFDAEGVEFNVNLSDETTHNKRPYRARCNIAFGYSSWYADCVWVEDVLTGLMVDLDTLGAVKVIAIESQALALAAQHRKNT
jgi:hypothetical protein